MTAPTPSPGSYLDFFILEASEYVAQLDACLLRAGGEGPDLEGLQRAARALRGSATMAKLPAFAELASGVEAVGRSLRQGAVQWNDAVKGALTAAVDDLKLLVRAARAWSAAEDEWAQRRTRELTQFAVGSGGMTTPARATTSAGSFFASETSNIAAGLELLATRPDDQVGASNVLRRVRGLRGVAGLRDIPALAEVADAAEIAVRPLEIGEKQLGAERVQLLQASAALLRGISAALSGGIGIDASNPEYMRFAAEAEAMRAHEEEADRVLPITKLFYDDAGPHIVSTADNPPTTPAQRFRMEIVSLSERLQQVVDEARRAADEMARSRAERDLRGLLRAIRETATSFGEHAVAKMANEHLERPDVTDPAALNAIAAIASVISVRRASVPIPMPATGAIPAAPAPWSAGGGPAATLDDAIARFDSLAAERLAEPVSLEDDVIPVDALLYRGRAALDRAIEIRDDLRRANAAPSAETLEELYDLLELARVE